MKNPLESLHKTIGMGVILTAVMVLIIAIFYWESSEPVKPAAAEKAATEAADTAKDAAGAASSGGSGSAGSGNN